MISKFEFEHKLEEIAEKFYFNAAAQMTSARGGNSRGNEVYFGNVSSEMRDKLGCQQLILPKGECPDSGIFGAFQYLSEDAVDWDKVISGSLIVLEVLVPNDQKRYIEIKVADANLPEMLTKECDIQIKLNDMNGYGEFFGIEYKASKNDNPNSITVASFNSTCPSGTKTTTLNKITMIHNLATPMKSFFNREKGLKKIQIKLKIQFSMYYFIVNDVESGTRSEVKHIFLCNGGFFAPSTTESEAEKLSKQIKPADLGLDLNLYRVKLRYRPFFESRAIRSNGYGLYTSWEPKVPGLAREAKERASLLKEVEKIQQSLSEEVPDKIDQFQATEDENVIFLSLREKRMKNRSVA
jgi:hypothetical protein